MVYDAFKRVVFERSKWTGRKAGKGGGDQDRSRPFVLLTVKTYYVLTNLIYEAVFRDRFSGWYLRTSRKR
jgi:hypothetical protein